MHPFIQQVAAARRGKGVLGPLNVWQQMRDIREVILRTLDVLEPLMLRAQLELAIDARRALGIEPVDEDADAPQLERAAAPGERRDT
jgi:hypothetical protein